MAEEIKNLLKRDDIRTMKKDIKKLKRLGSLNPIPKKVDVFKSNKEVVPSVKPTIKPKISEDFLKDITNQTKVPIIEAKPETKTEINLQKDVLNQISKEQVVGSTNKASYISINPNKKRKFMEDVEEFINLS